MCEEEAGNRVAFTVGTFLQATDKLYSVNFLKTANKIYFAISSLLFFSILPLPQCQTVSEVQIFVLCFAALFAKQFHYNANFTHVSANKEVFMHI